MKIYLFVLFVFTSFLGISQNNEGSVVYEDKFNIHKNLPPEMEAMKDRIPEFRTSKKILSFNGTEALYKELKEDKPEQQEFRGEGRRMRRNRDANNEYYTSLTDNNSIDKREFFGKEFLIEGERTALKWKITGDQKQVGSYLCQKAMYKDSTSTTIAWFTPMIPVASGPDDYFGLPGLVLHVDINDGERLITAQNIELKELEEGTIVKPTSGKKITKEEFDVMRKEKMKEMEQEYGGSGNRRFRFRG
jgi:GLPGLI family protein